MDNIENNKNVKQQQQQQFEYRMSSLGLYCGA